jgi:hypothetical protein
MRPHGYWQDFENHRRFAQELAEKNGWKSREDWYNLQQSHFDELKGGGLLRGKDYRYVGSPFKFICTIFPNELWLPWKMKTQAPNKFWKDVNNLTYVLDYIASMEGFTNLDYFYTVSQATYEKYGLTDIQNKFTSQLKMLRLAFPCKEWKEWKFRPVTNGFWKNRKNIEISVKELALELGITEPSGWYAHTGNTIDKYLGTGLLANDFDCSFSSLLKYVYPEFQWKMYMFVKAAHRHWNDDANLKEWLVDFMNHRGFTTNDDLYKSRYEDVVEFHGRGVIDGFNGSYIRLFIHLIPDLDILKFFKAGVSKIANEYCDFRDKQEGCVGIREYRVTGTRWHVDIYYPSKNLAVEFLGDYWHGNPNKYKRDDINPSTKLTYGEMYDHTFKRMNAIIESGINVEFIWETDYKKIRI